MYVCMYKIHNRDDTPKDHCRVISFRVVKVVWLSSCYQWPRVLRRESAAACLLEMRVQIPLRGWMPLSLSYECCVLSGRVLWVGLITLQWSPTDCGVS